LNPNPDAKWYLVDTPPQKWLRCEQTSVPKRMRWATEGVLIAEQAEV
jgi:hypothetical protein